MLKLSHLGSVVCLVGLVAVSLSARPAPGKYLLTENADVTVWLPPAPADNSLTTAADVTTLLAVQQRRTPDEIALANVYAHDRVYGFAAVLGPWFTAENLPGGAAFFEQVAADVGAISAKAKRTWQRPRPPLLDTRIHACVPLPKSGSYPSGHTMRAFVWAGLLAEVFPEQRAELRAHAELIAWSRVIGGVHYPSDITAGRMLGERLVAELLKSPALRADLAALAAEAKHAAEIAAAPAH